MRENKKIRVLLCSPYGENVGGISRWTGHILRYYQTINTSVALTHFYPNGREANVATPFIRRFIIGIIAYVPFLTGLNRKLKNDNYHLVHFVTSASISLIKDLFSLKIAKNKKVKTIIHFRFGRIPELFEKRNWEQKLLHKVISLADKAIVIDKKSYDVLTQEGYRNIDLLPNPLTPTVSEIIEGNKYIVKEDRKLVFAGHVTGKKGVLELIEACKSIPAIKLKMLGLVTGEMKMRLLAKAGEDHANWLEIAGEQDFETTIKEMLSAGVFVLPTYTEGFPNVIIESMACACPIVTTRVGAIPEMLEIQHGFNNGIVIEPKDVEQLRKSIVKMLDDREYAIQCGLNAREIVNKKYSMPQVWRQMERIWMSVV